MEQNKESKKAGHKNEEENVIDLNKDPIRETANIWQDITDRVNELNEEVQKQANKAAKS